MERGERGMDGWVDGGREGEGYREEEKEGGRLRKRKKT